MPRRFSSAAAALALKPDSSSKTLRSSSARCWASALVISLCSRCPPSLSPRASARRYRPFERAARGVNKLLRLPDETMICERSAMASMNASRSGG
jgi:hypothetical protein